MGKTAPPALPPLLEPVDPRAPAGPNDLSLGEGFLMGTQTSAVQVEGGGIDNDITRWASTQKGWAQANPGLDHWNHVEADYQHLQNNGHTAHGFTIDWARIQPTENGPYDQAAIDHYKEEIRICRAHGMEPMVTLLQYAIPNWLADKGGILNPETPRKFEAFARYCVRELGDNVTYWNTMNEPNTLAAAGFLIGIWPPGESSLFETGRAFDALLHMHAAGARAIHTESDAAGRRSMVSFAHAYDARFPYQWWNPADQGAAELYDYISNEWFLDSIAAGKSVAPVGSGEEIPDLKGSLDYLCLNYYGRTWTHVALDGGGTHGSPIHDEPNPDAPAAPVAPQPATRHVSITAKYKHIQDRANPKAAAGPGVDCDPDGIFEVGLRMWNQFRLPIMITENGVDIPQDMDDRDLRGRAIVDTLSAFQHLRQIGVQLLGYLHWTDWDSPEWQDGWTQHYGLFGFDPVTRRTWDKPSAAVFEAIARRGAIPEQWLSAANLQSPAERDGHCAHELRKWLDLRAQAAAPSPLRRLVHAFHLGG